MKVINKALLREFRLMKNCAWCKRRVEECDPAHIYSRGAGRVDVRCNLVNLCRECHTRSGAGHSPTRDELLAIAGKRDGKTPDEITEMIYRIRRDTKCKVWIVDEPTNLTNHA